MDLTKFSEAIESKDFLSLVDIIQGDIENRYGYILDPYERASDNLITDYDELVNFLDSISGGVEGNRVIKERATHYTLSENDEQLASFIYIPESYFNMIQNLEEHSIEDRINTISTLAEEISHFCYNKRYLEKHGEDDSHANAEMMGSIDKYFILKNLLGNNEELASIVHDASFEATAEKHKLSEGIEPQYFIGHGLARALIGYLENEFGTDEEKIKELRKIDYMESKEQLEYLLWDKGLTFNTYLDSQYDAVKDYLNENGIGHISMPIDEKPEAGKKPEQKTKIRDLLPACVKYNFEEIGTVLDKYENIPEHGNRPGKVISWMEKIAGLSDYNQHTRDMLSDANRRINDGKVVKELDRLDRQLYELEEKNPELKSAVKPYHGKIIDAMDVMYSIENQSQQRDPEAAYVKNLMTELKGVLKNNYSN